ncbi:transporter substrate-binding domain-containing protein [uncultured Microbacterium sp.]|uniref:transporter substrate-binding domain-containing protein n=1 Tax=uncultured Microbacterium sp. TaxID=191216 RepID=UPI0025F82DBA|nr:transporter substrate-binding domain-containing protein [uncultured Microbacterium sp.]
MTRYRFAAVAVAASTMLFAGCGIQIPADPSGTLDAVEGGVLRAGVTPNGEWVRVGEDSPTGVTPNGEWVRVGEDSPTGTEVEALTHFAQSLNAEIQWTVGSEESLVRGLEDGQLDVVAGGLSDKTPWTNKAGVTRPYAEATLADGSSLKLVMLVPLGENAFVSALETFLTDETSRAGTAP